MRGRSSGGAISGRGEAAGKRAEFICAELEFFNFFVVQITERYSDFAVGDGSVIVAVWIRTVAYALKVDGLAGPID